jgi:RNA recognition motif-containing protein
VVSRPLLSSPKPTTRFLSTRALLPSRPIISTLSFQRRFNSEESPKENEEESSSAAAESVEDAAQLAAEPIVESDTAETAAEDANQTASANNTADATQPAPLTPSGWQLEPNNVVYVGNLFFEAKEEDLREHLGKYGEIAEVRMINDIRGYSKGYVY